jgi:hypothetical protein
VEEVYYVLKILKKISKSLWKKAQWKALDPKTRKLSACLLVTALYCLVFALACGVAVRYEAPGIEIFQSLGFCSTMAWLMLTYLSLASNVAGVMISRAERYQRLNPTAQKLMKGLFGTRLSVVCASYRAGHTRSSRSHSRSNASKDSSDDGESDSGEPPALPLPSVVPSFSFSHTFCKLNRFSSPWRFLSGFGCWRMSLRLLSTGRGWGK